jgi:nicotinamide phosphoribosyltransferase
MGLKNNPLLMTDGYKTGHHLMYAPGTTMVYSNYTCRSIQYMPKGSEDVVVFGVQYTFQYIEELWEENFFSQSKEVVCGEAKEYLSKYLMTDYDTSHFEALHDLGYLPIEVKSLEEGTVTKAGVPLFTIKNTIPEFFWITNFLETLISTLIWKPVHSASLALAYRKLLDKSAQETDPNNMWLVDYQAHDFSMRGMQAPEAAIASGMGFASLFRGSDTIPIMKAITHYYEDLDAVNSVNATEHSVMCSGSKKDEIGTLKRLMTQFPTGILSIVSDTWDLWKVVTEYIPQLKEDILARDGKVVIRPDSGDPVDIICGTCTSFNYGTTPKELGVIELLWDTFGGIVNKHGYKVLDSHIGAIYGDSITLERAEQIIERLKAKGFASTNIVFGVGSYSMGYATRDSQGGAVKSTAVEINCELVEIFKDPVTDDGTKKSAKGLLQVKNGVLKDQCTWREELEGDLKTIFKDGFFINRYSLARIRKNIISNK